MLVSTRRTQRVAARFQVQVRKQADGDAFITEVSHTLVVNAHGALIHLALMVQLNDILLIKHLITREERRCRVVWIDRDPSHLNEVAGRVYGACAALLAYRFPARGLEAVGGLTVVVCGPSRIAHGSKAAVHRTGKSAGRLCWAMSCNG